MAILLSKKKEKRGSKGACKTCGPLRGGEPFDQAIDATRRKPTKPHKHPLPKPRSLACHEVWGGNDAVDRGVTMPGLDAWLYCCPYAGQIEGGDLHFVSSCWAGLLTRVVVSDLTGTEELTDTTSKRLRKLMRRFTNFGDQSHFVSAIRSEFASLADAGGFGTALIATYYAPTNLLTLSNAGHPPPLKYCAKSHTWSVMLRNDTDNSQLDGDSIAARYDQFELTMSKGDAVIFYTDSLIDAKDRKGIPLGIEGLSELVERCEGDNPAEFMHALLVAIGQRTGDPCEHDDVTILILKANDIKPPFSLPVIIKANVRLAGAVLLSPIPGTGPIPWPDHGLWYTFGKLVGRVNHRWGPGALTKEQRAT